MSGPCKKTGVFSLLVCDTCCNCIISGYTCIFLFCVTKLFCSIKFIVVTVKTITASVFLRFPKVEQHPKCMDHAILRVVVPKPAPMQIFIYYLKHQKGVKVLLTT